MLAAKIVQFSEGMEGLIGRDAGGDCTCRLENNNECDPTNGSLSSTTCAEKTAAYLNRKPPFMHFKRLNFWFVKTRGYLPGCISVILLP